MHVGDIRSTAAALTTSMQVDVGGKPAARRDLQCYWLPQMQPGLRDVPGQYIYLYIGQVGRSTLQTRRRETIGLDTIQMPLPGCIVTPSSVILWMQPHRDPSFYCSTSMTWQ